MLNISRNSLARSLCTRLQSASVSTSVQKIVLTDDGKTIVAWHPKTKFPFECTRPLPDEQTIQTTTVLRTNVTPELLSIFNKKTPEQAREELMNITNTTKHRWFPRARDKRSKNTTMDREYL